MSTTARPSSLPLRVSGVVLLSRRSAAAAFTSQIDPRASCISVRALQEARASTRQLTAVAAYRRDSGEGDTVTDTAATPETRTGNDDGHSQPPESGSKQNCMGTCSKISGFFIQSRGNRHRKLPPRPKRLPSDVAPRHRSSFEPPGMSERRATFLPPARALPEKQLLRAVSRRVLVRGEKECLSPRWADKTAGMVAAPKIAPDKLVQVSSGVPKGGLASLQLFLPSRTPSDVRRPLGTPED